MVYVFEMKAMSGVGQVKSRVVSVVDESAERERWSVRFVVSWQKYTAYCSEVCEGVQRQHQYCC